MATHHQPAGPNSWQTCPRCGLTVYKSSRADHDRRCLLVEAYYGSPKRMVEAFREDPALTPAAVGRRMGVVAQFVTELLVAGGVSYAEIDGRRVERPRGPRRLCRRCEVLLDARGVRPSLSDRTMCAWCAAELAERGRATCTQ